MPAAPRTTTKIIGDDLVPRVKPETRDDILSVAEILEVEYGKKVVEFAKKIAETSEWSLDDWIEISRLVESGRTFSEVRVVFSK
jgi:hypothetical protein